jgi:hypothetical protein
METHPFVIMETEMDNSKQTTEKPKKNLGSPEKKPNTTKKIEKR